MRLSFSPRMFENARFAALVALLLACALWGGGARIDIPGLIFLQPLAVLLVALILIVPGPVRWEAVRIPLLLLAGLAMFISIQLIPLPPEWWAQLPGHAPFAANDRFVGLADVWRPISLTPDLTLASLVGLVVPAAALIGFASIPEERTYKLLPYLLGIAGVSAVLGVAQVLSGANSPLYLYSITNNGSAVGLFSNRNHQALLLAICFPLLVLWVRQPMHPSGQRALKLWIAGATSLFLLLATAMTGSRAGLFLALGGLAFAWLHFRGGVRAGRGPGGAAQRFPLLVKAAPALGGLALLWVAFLVSRAESVERLFGLTLTEDRRVEASSTVLQMAGDFFPFGSGFGSFDPVFRIYEPFALLRSTYFNHAHNDLLETAVTGGLPGLALIALFLIWVAPRLLAAFRRSSDSRAQLFAGFSGALIALVLLSSLVDYPLRTPLMSALFALACGWVGQGSKRSRAPRRSD